MIKFIKKNRNYVILLIILLLSVFLSFFLYKTICINSFGNIAILESELFLIALKSMLIIVIPVICLIFYFLYTYHVNKINSIYQPNWSHSFFLETVVWVFPIFIIIFLANLSWKTTHSFEPSKPIFSNIAPITIEVISLDWKWLFIYPEYQIAVVNECCFPINVPINFHITSNTVMNSFFIPKLGSQIYAMAGMNSKLNLIANKSMLYKGFSSNYSGNGFSDMKFNVKTVNNNIEFKKWIYKIRLMRKKLIFKKQFLKLSEPNNKYLIQYFSRVNPFLFTKIVQSFQ